MHIVAILIFPLFLGEFSEGITRPFPFGPRRRILPGQRASGCVDCANELKQCVEKCLQQHDCSEIDIKEGFCPVGSPRPAKCAISSVLSVCESDSDCPGTKKCCESGCSKVCSNALPVPPAQESRRSSKRILSKP
ncbi:waprin-Enh1-like [Centruroides sculpturatus]|uniref:waprin-Enh1-like n=1 Tax=Centruroides sculpturatus TaxID=218467 RepID=UPI000C6CF04B|nr:waprin-Enh1-like [Centruroides sculpturatus]XP_023240402.1 waprin-Enh1-like [Centruroides sculpturatus]